MNRAAFRQPLERRAACPLAVVGGGPSVLEHLDELRRWEGDVWGINQTASWLRDQGVSADFYTVDPNERAASMGAGVPHAILSDIVHPSAFENAETHEMVRLGDDVQANCSSASTAPMIAAYRGHTSVTFFGCDGNFSDQSHIYRHEEDLPQRMWVESGGREFMTRPDLLLATGVLADLIRGLPNYLFVRGNGMLGAFVEQGGYTVTHTTRDLAEKMRAV